MTQTTVRILTTVVNTGFIAAPLVSTQTFQRFKREVLEGTFDEMVDIEDEFNKSNETASEVVKRQAEFPGNPEEDQTK